MNFNGHPRNVARKIKRVVRRANRRGLVVTSTTDGTHSATSYHYPRNNPDNKGHAVDLAGSRDRMIAFQRYAAKKWPRAREIFGPDGWYVKNGVRIHGAFPGHQDHVHIAR